MKLDINGVLLLDKSQGITSNEALQRAKRIFLAKKAGHTGSLDPLACGMLPVCFGEATKFAHFFLNHDKEYHVKMRLGIKTDSGDSYGQSIRETQIPPLTRERIEQTLSNFLGDIDQTPPMFSAIKVNGQRLYKLARQGLEVARQSRKVTIYKLQLNTFDEHSIQLVVHCSKGTYIRTLVEDIAEQLGTLAHVEYLYRSFVGHFKNSALVTLAELEASRGDSNALQKYLLPLSEVLPPSWPKITLSASSAFYFQQGQAVTASELPPQAYVQVCDSEGTLIGVGEVTSFQQVKPKRLIRKTQ